MKALSGLFVCRVIRKARYLERGWAPFRLPMVGLSGDDILDAGEWPAGLGLTGILVWHHPYASLAIG